MADALKTPLHAWHSAHGGRMVDFAGWSMPVQYTSIVAEHQATRTAVGLFDISHMGRLEFTGSKPLEFLDRLLTRRVAQLTPGAIRYGLVTNERGGILDDVLVYHLRRPDGSPRTLMVVNAANREKVVCWLELHRGAHDPALVDLTGQTAMIAIQGPCAVGLVDSLWSASVADLRYYSGMIRQLDGVEMVISRTGYTGEDGCELWIPRDEALGIWRRLLDHGRGMGAVAAGLGARDTLRLEAGMPLYGHELSEQIQPFQAGLQFAVQLEGRDFIGRDALCRARLDTTCPLRVGLVFDGRRLPREHCSLWCEGAAVGEVTSGTFSPTLQRPIAMGYVAPQASQVGTRLEVDVRGQRVRGEVVDLPFYRRPT